MPRAVQVINAFKQNLTGGAFEALAAGTGDSLSIANYREGSRASIDEIWAGDSAHAAQFSIRSPRLHDFVRGIRLGAQFNPTLSGADGDPQIIFPQYARQQVYKSDTLTVEVNATAADNVNLFYLVSYDDLPGSSARFANWQEILPSIRNYVGIFVNAVSGAAGDWGTSRALNADDDRLKADTDYALLGVTSTLPVGCISIVGPDTGNYRVGVPGSWAEHTVAGWFVDLSLKYGEAYIPIINANNRANTLIQLADAGGAITAQPHLIFAELG